MAMADDEETERYNENGSPLDGEGKLKTSMATNTDSLMMGESYTIHPMLGAFRGLG